MYKKALRPAWAEINLANLAYNARNIKAKVGPGKEIIGIIKSDAYGHGAFEVARVLKENGVKTFGVATLHEAILLRDKGIREEIIILSLTPDQYADILAEYNLTPVTCGYGNAAAISDQAEKSGKIVYGLIALDTGMGRIGLLSGDKASIDEVKKISALPNFKIKGLFSHFATSDSADKTYAKEQEMRYNAFYDDLRKSGVLINYRTLANSAAIMELPSTHFDAVRTGIILYGCYPSDEVDKEALSIKPVMSIKADIVHLKRVPSGTSISYGRAFTTARESLIATICLGYADGYPRIYSASAKAIIRGSLASIAGRICMDQCMIDVTDIPNVKVGDEAILMGSDGKNTILADDIARASGTINYEILCGFGMRLPKIYT